MDTDNAKEAMHTEADCQVYRQMLEDGYDVRIARAEAAGTERSAREVAKQVERMSAKQEQAMRKKRADENTGKPKKEDDTVRSLEKGRTAPLRMKLFAEVRQREEKKGDIMERLRYVRQQPLSQRTIPEELTPVQKKYLLTMYQMDSSVLTQTDIATKLKISAAGVYKTIHGLIELGMIERYDRCGIALSEKGLFVATNLHDCCSAIVEDLLRYLPPEKFCQQEREALDAVLKMPQSLVQELLRGLETRKNFLEQNESRSAAE